MIIKGEISQKTGTCGTNANREFCLHCIFTKTRSAAPICLCHYPALRAPFLREGEWCRCQSFTWGCQPVNFVCNAYSPLLRPSARSAGNLLRLRAVCTLTPHRIAQPHTIVWGYWDFVPLAQGGGKRDRQSSIVNFVCGGYVHFRYSCRVHIFARFQKVYQ